MEKTVVQTNSQGHNVAASGRDFDFFYAGLEQRELLVQKCSTCGELRNPPGPSCASCHSLKWEPLALSGNGIIYSFMIHHHPPLQDFPVPLPVALIAMAEGIRMVGPMEGTPPDALRIGLPVRVEFVRRGNVAAFRFGLAAS
jgi:uncharacterized OB-fold protein